MSVTVGIGLAFVAMLCWGFGDFLIQKSTRKLGDWETLFVICAFGSVVLIPFVWRDLPHVILGDSKSLLILFVTGVVLFLAALLEFESLKKGKLSVIEPIWSFEIPASAVLAYVILGEHMSIVQITVAATLIIGLLLVSFREKYSIKKYFLERGVFIAFISAFIMGAANFLYGWGSRITDPLMINFFVNIFITIVTGVFLISRGRFRATINDAISYRDILLPMSIADNAAWIAFAYAMSVTPIGVAVALSESYIIIAVLLGLFVNKEKLQRHQKIGLIGAIISALVLAVVTAG